MDSVLISTIIKESLGDVYDYFVEIMVTMDTPYLLHMTQTSQTKLLDL